MAVRCLLLQRRSRPDSRRRLSICRRASHDSGSAAPTEGLRSAATFWAIVPVVTQPGLDAFHCEIMAANGWSLRELYRTLETRGAKERLTRTQYAPHLPRELSPQVIKCQCLRNPHGGLAGLAPG